MSVLRGRRVPIAACPWLAVLLLALLAAPLCGEPVATASNSPTQPAVAGPTIEGVNVGFDGHYKVGYWAPVEVLVQGGSEAIDAVIDLELPDDDDEAARIVPAGPEVSVPRPVRIAAGERVAVPLVAKFGDRDGWLRVNIRIDAEVVATRRFEAGLQRKGALPVGLYSSQELIVNLGAPVPIQPVRTEAAGTLRETTVALVANAAELPLRWFGYDGVDWLLVTTSRAESLQPFKTGGRIEALDAWVRGGGRLLLSAGGRGAEVLRAGEPLARFAPGELAETVRLPGTRAIENYAGSREPLDFPGGLPQVPRLTNVRGMIEAFEGARREDLPLIVRSPYGLGEVVFVAFDLDRLAEADWPGTQPLLSKLLGRTVAAGDGEGAIAQARGDLSAQLSAALDEFRGVEPFSFAAVASLAVLYILCIGPLDYFVLGRWLGRPTLTWVTFPVYVLVFSGIAYGLAVRYKGDEARISQVDLIDVDLTSRLVRGTSWAGIFSPRTASYDLAYRPALQGLVQEEEAEPLLSWFGEPGIGIGGLDGAATGGLFRRAYEIWPRQGRVTDLPVPVWASKSVTARWHGPLVPDVEAELRETTFRANRLLASIEGVIENPFHVPLTDGVVFFGSWAYPVGDLAPGQPIRITSETESQIITTYLGVQTGGISVRANRYDPTSRDVRRIMEMLMFYEVATGVQYTGMHNDYQEFVDLSHLLALGRAVFLGYGPPEAPASELTSEEGRLGRGAGQYRSFYRIVAPVQRAGQDEPPAL